MRSLIFIVVLMSIISGCKGNDPAPPEQIILPIEELFPLEIGRFITYIRVESLYGPDGSEILNDIDEVVIGIAADSVIGQETWYVETTNGSITSLWTYRDDGLWHMPPGGSAHLFLPRRPPVDGWTSTHTGFLTKLDENGPSRYGFSCEEIAPVETIEKRHSLAYVRDEGMHWDGFVEYSPSGTYSLTIIWPTQ